GEVRLREAREIALGLRHLVGGEHAIRGDHEELLPRRRRGRVEVGDLADVRLLAPEVVREPDDDPSRAVESAGLADEPEDVLGTPAVDAAIEPFDGTV